MLPGPLGPYDLLAEIGRGASGTVYRARHRERGHEVAIKVLAPLGTARRREDARQRLSREARLVVKLDHHYIVRVHSVVEEPPAHIVMDLVAGETLAERLKARGAFAPEEALALVEKIALGVHHAHLQGVLHRDLKPGNIVLDARGDPRIIDFGIAKELDVSSDVLTETGTLVGTPFYLAPELTVAKPPEPDPRSDVWSLGVILYELLTGRRPFDEPYLFPLLAKIQGSDPPPPLRPSGETTGRAGQVALRALAKRPGDRPESALELARLCAHARSGEEGARSSAWLVGGALAVAGVAAIVLALLIARAPRAKESVPSAPAPPRGDARHRAAETLARCAEAERAVNRPEIALVQATVAIVLDPGFGFSWLVRAEASFARYDLRMAREDASRAIALSPKDARALLFRGRVRVRSGDAAGAHEDLSRAIALEPALRDAWVLRGEACWHLDDFPGTVNDETRALAIDPRCLDALVARGQAYVSLGRGQDAVSDLESAVALDPDNLSTLHIRATALAATGQIDRALADDTRVLERDPDRREALLLRGALRMRAGDKAGARQDLEHYLAIYSEDPKAPEVRRTLERMRTR